MNNGHDQDAKQKSSSSSSSYYYETLPNALWQEAKRQMGDDLTVWKDDVGAKELNKELRSGNGDEEEGEEGSG